MGNSRNSVRLYNFGLGWQRMRWLDGIIDSMDMTVREWLNWKLLHLCLTLCEPMAYSLPGSSLHGILQAIILKCKHMRHNYWARLCPTAQEPQLPSLWASSREACARWSPGSATREAPTSRSPRTTTPQHNMLLRVAHAAAKTQHGQRQIINKWNYLKIVPQWSC